MKIFFSYGHDEHAGFIKKIKKDLESKYAIKIWMDNVEIKVADPKGWESTIEKGIEEADEIVYFLTPHSARRDDGYCLNELAYSFICKKQIIPVMVDYIKPPISIFGIQYMDIENLRINHNEVKYNEFLEDLVSMIKREKQLNFESDQFHLRNYLDPMDFSYDIGKHLKNFVGREWLYSKVDDLLLNDDSRVLWITAEAGFGKTAFSTYLMHKHKNTIGIHYCKYDNAKRKDPINVLTNLIYQISTQVVEYKDILNSNKYKKTLDEIGENSLDKNVILDELLIQPLNKIKPNQNYFFIIDALDEAEENGKNELVDLIQNFIDLPSWLKIVVTSRPEPYLKRKLSELKTIELDAQLEENKDDLKEFIKIYENGKNCEILKDKQISSMLMEKSEGNILYLKEVIKAIIKGDITENEITELPSGMSGLYVNMFERYFPDVDYYEESVMSIFELLAAVNKPLSKELVSNILNMKRREFKKIIDSIGSLIEENDNGEISLYHKALMDWLIDEDLCSPDYFVDIEEGYEKIHNYFYELFDEKKSMSSLSNFELSIFTLSVKYLKRESSKYNIEFEKYFTLNNDDPNYIFEKDARLNNLYIIADQTLHSYVINLLKKTKDEMNLNEKEIFDYFLLLVKIFKISDTKPREYVQSNISKGLYSLLGLVSLHTSQSKRINNLYKFVDKIQIEHFTYNEYKVLIVSTFMDFVKEREILIKKIFPSIQKYAIAKDVNLQFIVPGYGLSEEYSLSPSFIDDHINSIREIFNSGKIFTIFMNGNRYGWMPLPYQIKKEKFESILEFHKFHSSIEILSLLNDWYILDNNILDNKSLPSSSYTLRKRTGEYLDLDKWTSVEMQLKNIMMRSNTEIRDETSFLSSTHREIETILDFKDQNSICLLRNIENNLPNSYPIEKYSDTDTYNIISLKNYLRMNISQDKLLEYSLSAEDLDEEGIKNDEYYRVFEQFMTNQLMTDIEQYICDMRQMAASKYELSEQSKYLYSKSEIFLGRECELKTLDNYIHESDNQPFILSGNAASGKSSLLAKCIEYNLAKTPDGVVYRFIGATASSTNTRNLLESIVLQLDLCDKLAFEVKNEDFYFQVKILLESILKPTLIVLDGLDQLREKDYLKWLPLVLPENLKIILSVSSDERQSTHYYDILYPKINQNILQITEPTRREILNLVMSLLKKCSRTLTTEQYQYFVEKVVNSGSAYLYLRIALDEIKTWKSSDNDLYLANSIKEMFEQYVEHLIYMGHPKILVTRVLGYITASHNGLSEQNLLDILNNDKEVLQHCLSPFISENTLQYSIINRLLLDLKPFTKEIVISGEKLINIEQKIIYDIVFNEFYTPKIDYYHEKLVQYFHSL